MAAPRKWEIGAGVLSATVPDLDALRAVKAGTMSMEDYRDRYIKKMAFVQAANSALTPTYLHPGWRVGQPTPTHGAVANGDSLLCACSKADAAAGRCHRAWLAPFLTRAGWRVILDGVEVPDA